MHYRLVIFQMCSPSSILTPLILPTSVRRKPRLRVTWPAVTDLSDGLPDSRQHCSKCFVLIHTSAIVFYLIYQSIMYSQNPILLLDELQQSVQA